LTISLEKSDTVISTFLTRKEMLDSVEEKQEVVVSWKSGFSNAFSD